MSADGKMLIWRMKDHLEFPIKGFLLAKEKKHSLHFNGGIKMIKIRMTNKGLCMNIDNETNTYLAGTENSGVLNAISPL